MKSVSLICILLFFNTKYVRLETELPLQASVLPSESSVLATITDDGTRNESSSSTQEIIQQPEDRKLFPNATGDEKLNKTTNSTYEIIELEEAEKLYPYLVSIQLFNQHVCDGTIIAPKWILSAAHCLALRMTPKSSPLSCSTVRGGSINDSDNPEYRICKTIFVNPWYIQRYEISPKDPDDIGLILLRTPYDNNNVIRLGKYDEIEKAVLSNTTYCTIMSYNERDTGKLKTMEEAADLVLTVAQVRLVPWRDCGPYHPGINELKEFCVLEFGKHVIKGSSGGPVLCNGRQYGIARQGSGEIFFEGDTSVYTRVDFYVKWMNQTIFSAPENNANRCIPSLYTTLIVIILNLL